MPRVCHTPHVEAFTLPPRRFSVYLRRCRFAAPARYYFDERGDDAEDLIFHTYYAAMMPC